MDINLIFEKLSQKLANIAVEGKTKSGKDFSHDKWEKFVAGINRISIKYDIDFREIAKSNYISALLDKAEEIYREKAA